MIKIKQNGIKAMILGKPISTLDYHRIIIITDGYNISFIDDSEVTYSIIKNIIAGNIVSALNDIISHRESELNNLKLILHK